MEYWLILKRHAKFKFEWSLAGFSLISQLVAGVLLMAVIAGYLILPYYPWLKQPTIITIYSLFFIEVFALFLISFHIVIIRPIYKVAYNLRNSWLSRNFIFLFTFLALMIGYLFVIWLYDTFPVSIVYDTILVVLGIFTVVSNASIYSQFHLRRPTKYGIVVTYFILSISLS